MYQWIDKLEYWLLQLPKPDKTIFLHVPLKNTLELMKSRTKFDKVEKSVEHLKNSEEAYIELSELYHWDVIECVKDDKMRNIDDINNELFTKVEELFK